MIQCTLILEGAMSTAPQIKCKSLELFGIFIIVVKFKKIMVIVIKRFFVRYFSIHGTVGKSVLNVSNKIGYVM